MESRYHLYLHHGTLPLYLTVHNGTSQHTSDHWPSACNSHRDGDGSRRQALENERKCLVPVCHVILCIPESEREGEGDFDLEIIDTIHHSGMSDTQLPIKMWWWFVDNQDFFPVMSNLFGRYFLLILSSRQV